MASEKAGFIGRIIGRTVKELSHIGEALLRRGKCINLANLYQDIECFEVYA
jgi:hypothetical protein